MADDTDTTRPGEAEAVEAVMAAMGEWPNGNPYRKIMTEAVGLAYPVIAAAVREQVEAAAYEQGRRDAHGTIPARIAAAERAVREQVARDIEATENPPGWWDWGDDHPCFGTGLELAAYIVRGGR